jgi:uncharacterized membrane protein YbhN (UPF0104 family)
MGLYAIVWALQGLAFWVLTWGMGYRLTLVEGVPAYGAAYVAGYIALFAPAGIGVRESLLVVFLGPILGAGAAVVAVTARLWTTLVELIPAIVFATGYLGRSRKEKEEGV